MKVIDKQLLFISSDERDSGAVSDFTVAMPSHLLTCRSDQNMRMVLNDVVMPYTWYNVQETNRHFEVIENGGTPFKVSLDVGSYHALQLRDHLSTQLNAASLASGAGYTYSVSFDEVSSKYTFSIGSPSGVNSFSFASETNDLGASAYKLLGFVKGSTNTFSGSSLQSTGAVSMMFSDALYEDDEKTLISQNSGLGELLRLLLLQNQVMNDRKSAD